MISFQAHLIKFRSENCPPMCDIMIPPNYFTEEGVPRPCKVRRPSVPQTRLPGVKAVLLLVCSL